MRARRLPVAAVLAVAVLLVLPAVPAASEGGAALPPPITLSGTVTDPDGLPVEGAEVQVVFTDELEPGLAVAGVIDATLSGVDGAWSLSFDEPSGLLGAYGQPLATPLPYAVLVLPPADRTLARTWWTGCAASWRFGAVWGSTDIPEIAPVVAPACAGAVVLDPGASVERDVQLRAGARLTVTARGSGGVAVGGATLVVDAGDESPGGLLVGAHPHEAVTGLDGVASVGGIDAGGDERHGADHYVRIGGVDGYRDELLDGVPARTFTVHSYLLTTLALDDGDDVHRTVWLDPACAPADPFPFPDVDPNDDHGWDWSVGGGGDVVCGEVRWLRDEGITDGYVDGTFRPTAPTSRAAIVTWLWRRAGEPAAPPTAPTFSDVPPSSPFHEAISWAAASGITGGYADGTFRPTAPATTQAVVVMAWRAAGEPGWPHPVGPTRADRGGPAWDLPVGHPFRSALRWALSATIIDPGVASSGPILEGDEVVVPAGAVPGEPLPRGLAAGIVHDLDARLGAAAAAG